MVMVNSFFALHAFFVSFLAGKSPKGWLALLAALFD
jgi:hypothetical protein